MSLSQKRIIILLTLIFAGCSRTDPTPNVSVPTVPEEFRDTSIVSRDPCSPPCWHMIVPGLTTEDEVKQILPTLHFLDSTSIRESETFYWDPTVEDQIEGVLLAVDYKRPGEQQAAGFLLVNGIVMDFTVYPNYSLSFQEVVTSIGPPDYVRVFPQTGVFPGCNIQFLWINTRVKINNRNQNITDCSYQNQVYLVDSINYFHDGWLMVWPLDSDKSWVEINK